MDAEAVVALLVDARGSLPAGLAAKSGSITADNITKDAASVRILFIDFLLSSRLRTRFFCDPSLGVGFAFLWEQCARQ
jgi:hypothetical protein